MVEILKSLIQDFSHIQEYEIKNSQGNTIGFQSTLITKDNFPFAGGTAFDLNLARRICTAESIERAFFFKSFKSEAESSRLLLKEYPTTCGFAAGFNEKKVIFRSICEAVERWAWSMWIDKGLKISRVNPVLNTKLSNYFVDEFDEIIFLKKTLSLDPNLIPEFVSKDLVWSVVLGIKDGGIFPGSRVTTTNDEMWEHALLEAWRHKNIFKNELHEKESRDVFEKRIKYFGNKKDEALKYCEPFKADEFPKPRLRILEKVVAVSDNEYSYFVFRALCHDYIGWEQGREDRFIY